MCKNPTQSWREGGTELFFIVFINKAGLLIIGHSVLQCLFLIGSQSEAPGKSMSVLKLAQALLKCYGNI